MTASNEHLAADVLRTVARSLTAKAYLERNPELYSLLRSAALRFVAGETREEAWSRAYALADKGYLLSLEYIGENTSQADACKNAKEEFLRLIRETRIRTAICFDLSHVGLTIDPQLALTYVDEMATEAKKYGHTLMISMEESEKTESILAIYKQLASVHSHIGITLQAHLRRTLDDLPHLLELPGRIRIVKGAFKEPKEKSISRSDELTIRYLELVARCVDSGHPVSIATHDERIIREAIACGYLSHPHVELEMLYGICPEISREIRENGGRVRIYLPYGTEWYLYLCHRLAENPPNLYVAIADMFDNSRIGQNPSAY